MKNTINTIKKTKINPINSKGVNQMSLYEICRWAALKDAIDIIGDKCEERKLDFDCFEIKPLDLLKYVDIATDTLYNKVLIADEKN